MRDSLAILGLTMSATERDINILEGNTCKWHEHVIQIKTTPQLLVVIMKKQLTSSNNYLARHTTLTRRGMSQVYIEVQTTYIL